MMRKVERVKPARGEIVSDAFTAGVVARGLP
jgi:hypothetical protein